MRHFQKLWNFPNGAGASDRKHVTIHAPARSCYQFSNNKDSFSIVPYYHTSVEARYHPRMTDVGANDKSSDEGKHGGICLRESGSSVETIPQWFSECYLCML